MSEVNVDETGSVPQPNKYDDQEGKIFVGAWNSDGTKLLVVCVSLSNEELIIHYKDIFMFTSILSLDLYDHVCCWLMQLFST